MNSKIFFNSSITRWYCTAALIVFFGSSSVFSQTQIVYNSFNSGFSRSSGNNSIVTSILGQSIFGVSVNNDVSVFTGYASFGTRILSNVKTMYENAPVEFALFQNYPNPFNPSTTIRYGLPLPSRVSLRIYNILGQQIAEIINTEQSKGSYEVIWNANVASGVYFYRIDAVSIADPNQRFTQLKKMALLK